MNIAQISYANTEPFFHFWDSPTFHLKPGVPKALAEAAKKGDIVAGPLPIVECWELEEQFEPLGPWSIAAGEQCRSVFVLSKVPFSELDHVQIGVTRESATSVKLCELLVREKYGNDVRLRQGLQLEDAAWLVIGDQALQLTSRPTTQAWPHVTDLATEWWNWKKKPFVFARWVVRKDLPANLKKELAQTLERSLGKGLRSVSELAMASAQKLGLSPSFMETYFQGIIYEMDHDAEASVGLFRDLVKGVSYGKRPVGAH